MYNQGKKRKRKAKMPELFFLSFFRCMFLVETVIDSNGCERKHGQRKCTFCHETKYLRS
jgi:hypothetical protein